MKQEIFIPEYSLKLNFTPNSIECYDLISKKVVSSIPFHKKFIKLKKVSYNSFQIIDQKDKLINTINIKLFSEKNRISTGAEYILDISMDSPDHGFYFGLYEIGEFSLLKNEELAIIRSFPIQYCSKGCHTAENMIYVCLRENETSNRPFLYYLVKIDWYTKKEPKILFKKPVPSQIMGISQIKDNLYLGLKTGQLLIYNIKVDEIIKNINLFTNSISAIELGFENIIVSSGKGEVASISTKGDILWLSELTNAKILTINYYRSNILVSDIDGKYFQLNPKTGSVIDKGIWNLNSVKETTTASNLINFRNWFVLAGYGGIWGFWSENHSTIYHHYMEDPLIRKIYLHPSGFFTGDDEGYIRFWKLGGISFK